jgi:hypothetical protein
LAEDKVCHPLENTLLFPDCFRMSFHGA